MTLCKLDHAAETDQEDRRRGGQHMIWVLSEPGDREGLVVGVVEGLVVQGCMREVKRMLAFHMCPKRNGSAPRR